KAQVKRAFDATKKPFAEPAYGGLERALDGYAHDWTAAVTESCKATQSDQVRALREACLEQRLEELRALVAILANADPKIVEQGDKIAFGLEPVAHCANTEVLLAPGLPPPELRDQAVALEKKLAAAKASMLAGQYLPALVTAKGIVDDATKLGFQPLVAEALAIRGTSLLLNQNVPEAEQAFADATYAAIRGKRDDIAAEAGLAAAMAIAEQGGRPDLAKIWLGHAVASGDRVGYTRSIQRRLLEVEGLIAADSGDFNAGIAAHEKALAAAVNELGTESPELINDEILLATTLSKAGAWGRAVPHYEHALALREQSVGKDHPDIATLESDLGAAFTHAGDYHKAHEAFARALAIREATYGKNSPMLMATLDNFGELLRREGDYPGALAAQQRAMAMVKLVLGDQHSAYFQVVTDTCDTLIAAGKLADAHALFDQILAAEAKTASSVLPATQASRAELALADKAWADARTFAEQSVAGYEAAGGKDNPALWRPLTALGRAELALARKDAARAALERALAIAEKAQIPAADLAATHDALAQLK
ncbi:MAG: tetratricopeptide repeat protein, partial [Acidobacteriota bacterium]